MSGLVSLDVVVENGMFLGFHDRSIMIHSWQLTQPDNFGLEVSDVGGSGSSGWPGYDVWGIGRSSAEIFRYMNSIVKCPFMS